MEVILSLSRAVARFLKSLQASHRPSFTPVEYASERPSATSGAGRAIPNLLS